MKREADLSSSRRPSGNCGTHGQGFGSSYCQAGSCLAISHLLGLHNQIEALRLDLNELPGQIEVLVNENELNQKRQKDFYIDLAVRLRRIQQCRWICSSGDCSRGRSAAGTTILRNPKPRRQRRGFGVQQVRASTVGGKRGERRKPRL